MDRRRALRFLAGACAAAALPRAACAHGDPILRAIPASGERLPAIGLGTWITFDVTDPPARAARGAILRAFFAAGGRLVDSSPMYGASEETIGASMPSNARALFSATKVWTLGALAGRRQMESSRALWKLARFDLMQVHNMLDWETHLPTLKRMKAEGSVRYIGVTTSHGRRHDLLEQLLRTQKLDFVQLTYNLLEREAQDRLLPLARERGIAVIVNRPFRRGELIRKFERHPLPPWAREIDCRNWAQVLLKFIVSHPAVTCAIPATTRVEHVRENLGASSGRLPDEALRRRMVADLEKL